MTFVENQREAKRALAFLNSHKNYVILIHYSCESFSVSEENRRPRITSISCQNFGNGQTQSFSLYDVATHQKFKNKIGEDPTDKIEKAMLKEFYSYVGENVSYSHWVHWNMRDNKFGFNAIDDRYKLLGGSPRVIPNEKKYDLSRLLDSCYGNRYAEHPRLKFMMEKNNLSLEDFLSGEEEADAFKNGKLLTIQQSTLRKVHVLSSLLELSVSGKLKTNATFWDLHGGVARLLLEKRIIPFLINRVSSKIC